MDLGVVPHDNVRSLIRYGHRGGEGVVAPREISQDAHSLGEVVGKKGEDGTKDIVVPPVVPPVYQKLIKKWSRFAIHFTHHFPVESLYIMLYSVIHLSDRQEVRT